MIYNLEGYDRFCLMNQSAIFIKKGGYKRKLLFLLIKVVPKSVWSKNFSAVFMRNLKFTVYGIICSGSKHSDTPQQSCGVVHLQCF